MFAHIKAIGSAVGKPAATKARDSFIHAKSRYSQTLTQERAKKEAAAAKQAQIDANLARTKSIATELTNEGDKRAEASEQLAAWMRDSLPA